MHRKPRIEGEVAFVPLTQGKQAIIDACSAEIVSEHLWHVERNGKRFYAKRGVSLGGKRRKNIYMHRALLAAPDGMEVDHIDGDGLNNKLSNLRLATRAQNAWNCGLHEHNTSGFKGVSWHASKNRWRAQITFYGKRIHIGYFKTPEAAYSSYCKTSERLRGEFAFQQGDRQ